MYRIPRIAIATRTVLLTIGLVVVLSLFEHLRSFCEIAVLSLIVAAAMTPAVNYFTVKRGQSRLLAVSYVFGLTVAAVLLVTLSVAPVLFSQAKALATHLPEYTAKLHSTEDWLQQFLGRFPMLPSLDTLASKASESASAGLKNSLGIAGKLVAAAVELAIVLVVAFFLLLEGPQLKAGALSLMPPENRALWGAQIDPIALKLGGYVQGVLISIVALTVYLGIILAVCQVPLAMVLALVGGLCAVIPLIGGYIGLVPITLVALTVSWKLAAVVLTLAYIGNWVVGHVLMPIVFSKSVHLSPLMVMLALLLGAETMGIFGALTAVPILATIQVLMRNLYVEPMERRASHVDGRITCPEPVRFHLVMEDA